jgi:allantoin racemase
VSRRVRIAVVNCNTTASMTERITAAARAGVCGDVDVLGLTPTWGVPSAEGFYDSFLSAAAVLDTLAHLPAGVDGVVMAGFGEHGREGARQLLAVPVVDITEAAAMSACLLGTRFGVVTTTPTAVEQIRASLAGAALDGRCVGVRAADLRVLALHDDDEKTTAAIQEAAEPLLAAGADVLVLGCAGMSHLAIELERRTGVPVVDGVVAAAGFCATLVRAGWKTSKIGAFAAPDPDKIRLVPSRG